MKPNTHYPLFSSSKTHKKEIKNTKSHKKEAIIHGCRQKKKKLTLFIRSTNLKTMKNKMTHMRNS